MRLRPFVPEDAPAVVELTRQTYGDGYPHPILYDAQALVRDLAAGRLWAVVAEDEQGTLVGHYALLRPEVWREPDPPAPALVPPTPPALDTPAPGPPPPAAGPGPPAAWASGPAIGAVPRLASVAETGRAMVAPHARGHDLMLRMRRMLEDRAQALGLEAIYGTPVTFHPASQKAYERLGNHPVGLILNYAPHFVATGFASRPGRRHVLLYFKFLRDPEPVGWALPERYREFGERVAERLGLTLNPQATPEKRGSESEIAGQIGGGRVSVEPPGDLGLTCLRVESAGPGAREALEQALRRTRAPRVLELPLVGWPLDELVDCAEAAGLQLAGIWPRLGRCDHLLMQDRDAGVGPEEIQVASEQAREVVSWILPR